MTRTPQYLLAIYIAEQRRGSPVSPGDVAAVLDRSPAATTEMLQRLDDAGLVTTEPYEGVALTETGRERARTLYDAHRTVSSFFRRVLDIDEHEAEAMELAGRISPTVAERLAAALACETTATRSGEEGPDGVTADGESR